jgi:hypothetical protein
VAGQRAGLAGDALHDVAVRGDDVDPVVERALPGSGPRVEQAAFPAGRHGHAHRGGQALAERPGGDLHAAGVPVLRVARGLRPPGAQRPQVLHAQPVPGQEQLQVQGEAGMPGGQHEPVPAQPLVVGRVVSHDLLEEQVGQRRQAHRGARVAVARLLDRVPGQHPDGVHRPDVRFGPACLAGDGLRQRRVPAAWGCLLVQGNLRSGHFYAVRLCGAGHSAHLRRLPGAPGGKRPAGRAGLVDPDRRG